MASLWRVWYRFGPLLGKRLVSVHVRKLCPSFPLFRRALRFAVMLPNMTNAGTTEPNIALMMFKGHASFCKLTAEASDTNLSAETQQVVQPVVSLNVSPDHQL